MKGSCLTRPRFDNLLITCEHASNATAGFARAFRGKREVLDTHRAWDPGALVLARDLAREFKAPLRAGKFTRLLIDLNRRETSGGVFSEFTPEPAQDALLAFHRKWRKALLADVRKLTSGARLLHVSCHSFTPELNGEVRKADVGLLYDPQSKLEKSTADAWLANIRESEPGLRVRRNYPYKGTADGVTSWLRSELPKTRYAGFEIELNHSFSTEPAREWSDIREVLSDCIRASMNARGS